MNEILLFIAIGFATWRLTNLIVSESGPFKIFALIRRLFGADKIIYDEYSNPIYPNQIIEMLSCPFCTSVWVGFFFAAYQYRTDIFSIIVYTMGYSGLSILIDRHIRRIR